jgi:hypothetical protein
MPVNEYTTVPQVEYVPADLTELLGSMPRIEPASAVLDASGNPMYSWAGTPYNETYPMPDAVQVSELGPIAPPAVAEQPPVPPQQVAEVTPSTGNYFADLLGNYTRGEGGGGQSSTQPSPPTTDSSYYMNLYNDRLAQGLPPSMEGDDPAYLAWLTQYLAGIA